MSWNICFHASQATAPCCCTTPWRGKAAEQKTTLALNPLDNYCEPRLLVPSFDVLRTYRTTTCPPSTRSFHCPSQIRITAAPNISTYDMTETFSKAKGAYSSYFRLSSSPLSRAASCSTARERFGLQVINTMMVLQRTVRQCKSLYNF
jgi:hypothetical protein